MLAVFSGFAIISWLDREGPPRQRIERLKFPEQKPVGDSLCRHNKGPKRMHALWAFGGASLWGKRCFDRRSFGSRRLPCLPWAASAGHSVRKILALAGAAIRGLLIQTSWSTTSAGARTHSVRMVRWCSSAPSRASFGRNQGNGFNSPPPEPYSRPLGNGN